MLSQDYHSDQWAETYNSAEDVLLWEKQSAVRSLCVRGSAQLGGFLMHAHLLQLLPQKLPQLQRVELVGCDDLLLQQLEALASGGACCSILVQRCSVTDRDCAVVEQVTGVTVDYE